MFKFPIGASAPGADHLEEHLNNQDFFIRGQVVHDGFAYTYAFVIDGMGSGLFSESGGQLAGVRLNSLIVKGLACQEKRNINVGNYAEFPDYLYKGMLIWLKGIIALTEPVDVAEFVIQHLMFTMVGFIITPELVVTMRFGDGIVQLNAEETFANRVDTPFYIGNHALPDGYKHKRLDVPLEYLVDAWYTESINTVLIATDGLLGVLTPDILDITSDDALYRKLILMMRKGKRSDDGTIVFARRS